MAARIPTTTPAASEDAVKLCALRSLLYEATRGTSARPDLGESERPFLLMLLHGASVIELCAATGMTRDEVVAALARLAH